MRLAILSACALVALGGCSPAEPPAPIREPIGVRFVASPTLEVREMPSRDAAVITTLQEGETVSILASREGWAEISLGFERSGWSEERHLSETKAAEPEATTTVQFVKPPVPVARPSQTSGEIILEARVDASGRVTTVRSLRNTTGSTELEQQNIASLRAARFHPLLVKGRKQEFIYEYRVEY